MADATPTPAPKRNSPHEFDQRIEDDLRLGDSIFDAANNVLYNPVLLGAGITASDLAGLGANITSCRTLSSKAAIATDDIGSLVRAEHSARTAMSNAIAVVRKAAKDKFAEGDPARKKYFVGITVEKASYEDLMQKTDELAIQITADALSSQGVTPAEITLISTTVAAWKIAAKAVTDKQDIATGFRNTRDNTLILVNATRHKVQSTADRKFPHTDPNNAAARAKFKLPEDREFGI
jgi:hypothetical protein